MRFVKSILVFVLILGFVTFWGIGFVSAQNLPLPQTGDKSLCDGARDLSEIKTDAFWSKWRDIYFDVDTKATPVGTTGQYNVEMSLKIGGSAWAYYQDPTKAEDSSHRIQRSQVYFGQIGIWQISPSSKQMAIVSSNSQSSTAKFTISGKEGDKLGYSISQRVCFKLSSGSTAYDLTHYSKNAFTFFNKNKVEITLKKAGEAPDISQTEPETNNPTSPSGTATYDYNACLQNPDLGCGSKDCCGKNKKYGVLPTIEYVECWVRCSLDVGFKQFGDSITNLLVEAINNAFGF